MNRIRLMRSSASTILAYISLSRDTIRMDSSGAIIVLVTTIGRRSMGGYAKLRDIVINFTSLVNLLWCISTSCYAIITGNSPLIHWCPNELSRICTLYVLRFTDRMLSTPSIPRLFLAKIGGLKGCKVRVLHRFLAPYLASSFLLYM